MSNRKPLSVQYMTRIAILGALSAILFMIEIPVVAFYKLDLSTLPALLGAFSMGPLAGVAIIAIKDILGLLHSSSAFVGELADFVMSVAYVVPAAIIYKMKKSRKSALIGMSVATVVLIVVAVIVNWKIMIPFYIGAMPNGSMDMIVATANEAVSIVDSEWDVLLFVTAPFNLLKGVVLSVLTFLLYKRLSPLLHVRK